MDAPAPLANIQEAPRFPFIALRAAVWALYSNTTSAYGGRDVRTIWAQRSLYTIGSYFGVSLSTHFLKLFKFHMSTGSPPPLPILSRSKLRNISGTYHANNGPLRGKYISK